MFARLQPAWLALVCLFLSGCVQYRVDPRVLGYFEAATGESVVIDQKGRLYYSSLGKREFIGGIAIDEQALSLLLLSPETSHFYGTKVVFSPDRRQITIEWAESKGVKPRAVDRATLYHAKPPPV